MVLLDLILTVEKKSVNYTSYLSPQIILIIPSSFTSSLPSQLEEVFTRYLSFFELGEMDFLQSEWIIKRRNYAATLNNRGCKLQKAMGHSSLNVSLTYLRGLEVAELKEEDMPML